jgi:hypothetical protein
VNRRCIGVRRWQRSGSVLVRYGGVPGCYTGERRLFVSVGPAMLSRSALPAPDCRLLAANRLRFNPGKPVSARFCRLTTPDSHSPGCGERLPGTECRLSAAGKRSSAAGKHSSTANRQQSRADCRSSRSGSWQFAMKKAESYVCFPADHPPVLGISAEFDKKSPHRAARACGAVVPDNDRLLFYAQPARAS